MKGPSMTSTFFLVLAVMVACCWFSPGAEAVSPIVVVDKRAPGMLKAMDDGDFSSNLVNPHSLELVSTWKRSSTDCIALLATLNQENKNEAFVVGPRSVLPLEKSVELKNRLEIVEKLVATGCPALVVF